jgi:hypothetical protein
VVKVRQFPKDAARFGVAVVVGRKEGFVEEIVGPKQGIVEPQGIQVEAQS